MRDISKFAKYGKNSIAKADRIKPRAYKRKGTNLAAFTVKGTGSRYLVRIAYESRRVLGECINLETGRACKGFLFEGHCFHVGRAILLLAAAAE